MQEGATGPPGATEGGSHDAEEGAGPTSLEEAAEGEAASAARRGELSCLGLHPTAVGAGGGAVWGGDKQWATPTNVSARDLPQEAEALLSVCLSLATLQLSDGAVATEGGVEQGQQGDS